MLLTLLYMVATWVQSWRLSSLKTRLSAILKVDNSRPSIMLYTAASAKDELNENKNKIQNGTNGINKDLLSSSFCSNYSTAKLGDLLWYQGDKRLCTIFPEQKVEVSDWLLFPYGKTIFPLQSYNLRQASLQDDTKMFVLIEADLVNYNPDGCSKATKLEDYGYIVTWTSNQNLAVILETDLDHITKFSTALMQEHCFINNGLSVLRIESVSVSGKPCICNYERFNIIESKKVNENTQWNSYVRKLGLVSSTARLVSQQGEPTLIKEIPGLLVSQGSKPVSLEMPAILEVAVPNSIAGSRDCLSISSVPTTPPCTPAIKNINNAETSKLLSNFNKPLNKNSSIMDSLGSLSNMSSARSKEFILEESSKGSTPFKSVKKLEINCKDVEPISTSIPKSSLSSNIIKNSPIKKTKNGSIKNAKPPNILIYADSAVETDNIQNVLEMTVKENKYTIYSLTSAEAKTDIWMDQTNLVIVCGNVGNEIASQLTEYVVQGGKLLALCSDILKTFLPTFKTAEVRENELVSFSYGKWKRVQMMHHIFCYQASPVRTKFSQDLDDSKSVAPVTPITTCIYDKLGKSHQFHVKTLGSEETWHTPSILLADLPSTGGKAVFSQIHLEADPSQYEFEENKYSALKKSNFTRLEIFSDLLKTHLGIEVNPEPKPVPVYSSGFFLGRHELKLEMIQKLKPKMQFDNSIKPGKIELQFCESTNIKKQATSMFLPIMIHSCPEKFSTVDYFENLKTEKLGRLVIYSDIMTSSMDLVGNQPLHHGLVIIPYRQTKGQGRGRNMWLSPEGCAMFTLQLHIPLTSVLGKRISLIQHVAAVSLVSAIKSMPGYENIDIRIKWPNDTYSGNLRKISGLMVITTLNSSNAVCNIGVGINLSNKTPTTCINDLIMEYNEKNGTKLKKIKYEKLFALIFNEFEVIYNKIQEGNMEYLYSLYYKFWMHKDAEVTVILPDGNSEEVTIIGIDEFGFLEVKGKGGNILTVHPNGNSFDVLKGLIAPKMS